jgi:hypothetical protein
VLFTDFQSHFQPFGIFSIQDIRKWRPGFDSRRLVEWQTKNYIRRVVNKWYCFTDWPVDEVRLFLVSNSIYSPSYVSLESALSYYGLIPEAAISVQAVSSLKTRGFNTSLGRFAYRNLKSSNLFGARLVQAGNRRACVADPGKAWLDFLYLNPSVRSSNDFDSVRLNVNSFRDQVNLAVLEEQAEQMSNLRFMKRFRAFMKWIVK